MNFNDAMTTGKRQRKAESEKRERCGNDANALKEQADTVLEADKRTKETRQDRAADASKRTGNSEQRQSDAESMKRSTTAAASRDCTTEKGESNDDEEGPEEGNDNDAHESGGDHDAAKVTTKGWNYDQCSSCGEGGSLICCDRCPRAFHFDCVEPPLDPTHLPEGNWYCNVCLALFHRADSATAKRISNFRNLKERETRCAAYKRRYPKLSKLFEALISMNTKAFSLPAAIKRSLSHDASKRNEVKSLVFSELFRTPELSVQRYMPEIERVVVERKDEVPLRATTTTTTSSTQRTTATGDVAGQHSTTASATTASTSTATVISNATTNTKDTETGQRQRPPQPQTGVLMRCAVCGHGDRQSVSKSTRPVSNTAASSNARTALTSSRSLHLLTPTRPHHRSSSVTSDASLPDSTTLSVLNEHSTDDIMVRCSKCRKYYHPWCVEPPLFALVLTLPTHTAAATSSLPSAEWRHNTTLLQALESWECPLHHAGPSSAPASVNYTFNVFFPFTPAEVEHLYDTNVRLEFGPEALPPICKVPPVRPSSSSSSHSQLHSLPSTLSSSLSVSTAPTPTPTTTSLTTTTTASSSSEVAAHSLCSLPRLEVSSVPNSATALSQNPSVSSFPSSLQASASPLVSSQSSAPRVLSPARRVPAKKSPKSLSHSVTKTDRSLLPAISTPSSTSSTVVSKQILSEAEIDAQAFKLLSRALYELPTYVPACVSEPTAPTWDRWRSPPHALVALMHTLYTEQNRFFSEWQCVRSAETPRCTQQLNALLQQYESASLSERRILLSRLHTAVSSQLHSLLLQALPRTHAVGSDLVRDGLDKNNISSPIDAGNGHTSGDSSTNQGAGDNERGNSGSSGGSGDSSGGSSEGSSVGSGDSSGGGRGGSGGLNPSNNGQGHSGDDNDNNRDNHHSHYNNNSPTTENEEKTRTKKQNETDMCETATGVTNSDTPETGTDMTKTNATRENEQPKVANTAGNEQPPGVVIAQPLSTQTSSTDTFSLHDVLLSQLHPLFLQFLAWQRLMQLSYHVNTVLTLSAAKERVTAADYQRVEREWNQPLLTTATPLPLPLSQLQLEQLQNQMLPLLQPVDKTNAAETESQAATEPSANNKKRRASRRAQTEAESVPGVTSASAPPLQSPRPPRVPSTVVVPSEHTLSSAPQPSVSVSGTMSSSVSSSYVVTPNATSSFVPSTASESDASTSNKRSSAGATVTHTLKRAVNQRSDETPTASEQPPLKKVKVDADASSEGHSTMPTTATPSVSTAATTSEVLTGQPSTTTEATQTAYRTRSKTNKLKPSRLFDDEEHIVYDALPSMKRERDPDREIVKDGDVTRGDLSFGEVTTPSTDMAVDNSGGTATAVSVTSAPCSGSTPSFSSSLASSAVSSTTTSQNIGVSAAPATTVPMSPPTHPPPSLPQQSLPQTLGQPYVVPHGHDDSPHIAVLSGKVKNTDREFEYIICRNPLVIGRGVPSVDMDLSYYTDSRTVSHRHCQIAYDIANRCWVLENFGRNGTRVNDKQIGRLGSTTVTRLESGATIEMGKFTMRFLLKPFKPEEFPLKKIPLANDMIYSGTDVPNTILSSLPRQQ